MYLIRIASCCWAIYWFKRAGKQYLWAISWYDGKCYRDTSYIVKNSLQTKTNFICTFVFNLDKIFSKCPWAWLFKRLPMQKSDWQIQSYQNNKMHCFWVNFTLFSPERKNTGGLFGIGGTSFLEFKVQTFELGWKVGRRYSYFVWLRAYLLKAYPSHIIPPVP